MYKEIQLIVSPRNSSSEDLYKPLLARELRISQKRIKHIRILRKSIDSRRKNIRVHILFGIYIDQTEIPPPFPKPEYRNVKSAKEVIIIGCGPAGLFTALRLLELGYKPIVLERGKEVSLRKKDIALITRVHRINPDSNYCFGEGGAGTFSDGKLYTRSRKRGDYRRIFYALCWHGAPDSILYDAHPHIGSDKLPGIIKNIRRTIEQAGGEIHFNTRVTGFVINKGKIDAVLTKQGDKVSGRAYVLATGHSAKDIYYTLEKNNILLETKPFAMGIRVEHPQELIDAIQYHSTKKNEYLPPAIYSLSHQVRGRGVYSFCMCPGGFIVPSATSSEEVVVNGMSPSQRNSPYANSGIVVEIQPSDFKEFSGNKIFSGLKHQELLERKAWMAGGEKQSAPAQRLTNFISGKFSSSLPGTSYAPGVVSSNFREWLPPDIFNRLKDGILAFDKKMTGFLTEEAIVLGIESRTSSPVRIPRGEDTFCHPDIRNLYPCGEGAGYSGGIVSSAVDGERVAEKIVQSIS